MTPKNPHLSLGITLSLVVHITLAVALSIKYLPAKKLEKARQVRVHMVSVQAPPPAPKPSVPPPPLATPVVAPPPPPPVVKPQPKIEAKVTVPKEVIKPIIKPVAKPLETKPNKPEPVVAKKPLPTPVQKPALMASNGDDSEEDTIDQPSHDDIEGISENSEVDDFKTARLIHSSLPKPAYTTAALAVRIEGLFPVDVKIDPKGQVLTAKLIKTVGYGMDQLIVAAVMKAKFRPARDDQGHEIGGWVKIKFKLEIPE